MTDETLKQLLDHLRQNLLESRTDEGVWEGRLSSSPLATAVAVFALHTTDSEVYREHIANGLRWLADNQQADGGWGDAERLDPANLSSTLLCYAAIRASGPEAFAEVLHKAEHWIVQRAGSMEPAKLSAAVYAAYGKDRTFAVPILTMCALAGLLGEDGWRFVKPLPFELAVLPRWVFGRLKLTVVSYALPALIAIGQVKHSFDPSRNAAVRIMRRASAQKTLRLLTSIQPSNGGFLEAAPLTAFVTMSLASMGLREHPVVRQGVRFLVKTVRADGSWPIDTNLKTWCTNLAINAMLNKDREALSEAERRRLSEWYTSRQFKGVHPYTGAAPGGWGWTDLPGAVPDADDTAGALVALHRLGIEDDCADEAACKGLAWLMNLQNSDGGIPTFCRGWGKLEFDRSCPDITAHAILAWRLWTRRVDRRLAMRLEKAVSKAVKYLQTSQQPDGSWRPLWFGNPFSQDHGNPLYGTVRVLSAIEGFGDPVVEEMVSRGIRFLIASQNSDGGWGASSGACSTCEETALAIEALIVCGREDTLIRNTIVKSGLQWIAEHAGEGKNLAAAPMGLYFAKLWYAEKLYPSVFLLSAVKEQFLAEYCIRVRKMIN
jgi:squalene-hopene/tetraprenyl-beta-curcumene cyclase